MPNSKYNYFYKVINNSGWMLFDKMFILVLNFIVTLYVANYYGAIEYGNYQYAISNSALFEVIFYFIDSRVVKKRLIKGNNDELIWNLIVSKVFFSFIALLCGFIYIFVFLDGNLIHQVFILLLLCVIFTNIRLGIQIRFDYLLESRKTIIANNLSLFISGILQLVAVFFRFPIISIAIVRLITSFLSLSIIFFQYKKRFGNVIHGRLDISLMISMIKESIPLAIAASCAVIYSNCDSIMIGNMLSKDKVGVYSIALRLVLVVQIAIIPIRDSIYPKMIELYDFDKDSYKNLYVVITSLLTWIYVIGAIVSLFLFPIIISLLNPEYMEAFPVYIIYVGGTLFMYNAGLRAGHYTLIGRGDILMYSQLFSVVINLFLNFIFINKYDIYGAALATVLTQCLSLMFSNLFFGNDGREVFLWQIKGLNPIYIFKYKRLIREL